MKNNKNKSKSKKKYNNKTKNQNKKDSTENIESNEDIIKEIEEINTDIPKKQAKGKSKKINKKKISENNKKTQEDFDENDITPNAMILNQSTSITNPKITKMIEEEEKIESNKENKKDEFKIAKYFSQTKLIEPKNTSKDLLFIPEEEIILSLFRLEEPFSGAYLHKLLTLFNLQGTRSLRLKGESLFTIPR